MAKKTTRKELVQLIMAAGALPGVPTKWSRDEVENYITENHPHLLTPEAPTQPTEPAWHEGCTREDLAEHFFHQHGADPLGSLTNEEIIATLTDPNEFCDLPAEPATVPIAEVVAAATADYLNGKAPACITRGCPNKVASITAELCPTCLERSLVDPLVKCGSCGKAIPKTSAFSMPSALGTEFICREDCTATIDAQVRRITAKQEEKLATKGTRKSGKKSTRTGPTKRDLVLAHIADLSTFTVEEVARLLDTNMNNAATTVNLLITRPAANHGPIPFARTGKGTYTRIGFEQPNPVVEAKDTAATIAADRVLVYSEFNSNGLDITDDQQLNDNTPDDECELSAPK